MKGVLRYRIPFDVIAVRNLACTYISIQLTQHPPSTSPHESIITNQSTY
jgi:hypothetical protein